MSIEQPDAFAKLQGPPIDTSHIDNGLKSRVDDIGNMIIGGFDSAMNAATAKVGDMAGNIGSGMATVAAGVGSSGFSPFPGGSKSEPSLARSREPEIAIETPAMPEHVQQAAKAAVSQSFQVAEADPARHPAPMATPGVGVGQGMGVGVGV